MAEPVFQRPGEGRASDNPLGVELVFKVRGEQTDGTLTAFDVRPAKRPQLAPAKTGVKGARPQRAVTLAKRLDQGPGFGRACDPLTAASALRKGKTKRRIDQHL